VAEGVNTLKRKRGRDDELGATEYRGRKFQNREQHCLMLNKEGLADIICILHPGTAPACRAINLVSKANPSHITNIDNNGNFGLALRLSADLEDSLRGYQFGRSEQRCDIVIGPKNKVKPISNIHFRIYVTESSVIMFQEESTNGTIVNGISWCVKDKCSLREGSTLTMILKDEKITFIVRIPKCDGPDEVCYQRNLIDHFLYLKFIEQRKLKVGREHSAQPLLPSATATLYHGFAHRNTGFHISVGLYLVLAT
jgi:hypothetical protein